MKIKVETSGQYSEEGGGSPFKRQGERVRMDVPAAHQLPVNMASMHPSPWSGRSRLDPSWPSSGRDACPNLSSAALRGLREAAGGGVAARLLGEHIPAFLEWGEQLPKRESPSSHHALNMHLLCTPS